MHFNLATLVTVLLLQATAQTAVPEECPFWKDMVDSRGFRDLLLDAASSAYLDIIFPPEFGVEEYRLLTQLLKVLPTSQTIFSKISDVCMFNCSTMDNLHIALRIFCRTTNPLYVNCFIHPYWATLFTVTSNLSEFKISKWNPAIAGKDVFEKLRYGVDFHIVVRDQQILLAGLYDVRCLNCTGDAPLAFPVRLTRDKPIRGREITIACRKPLICQSPSFRTLTETLRHDNCSVKIIEVQTMDTLMYSMSKNMVDPRTLVYSPYAYAHELFFPTISTTFYFDRSGFATFVRALEPLPKEAVLFLPFSIFVWVASLACFIVCLLIIFFAFRVHQIVPDFHAIAVPLAASLVQQAYPVPPDAENVHSLRILFGVWYLMVTVLATGYKGVITSLLCNVPLDGELPEYTSLDVAVSIGSAACFVNFPEELAHRAWAHTGYIVKKNYDCLDGSGKPLAKAGKKAWFVFRPSSDEALSLKEELFRFGSVQTETLVSPVIAGPRLRSNSPYYRSINKLLGRAFEAGLFEKAERFAEFKSRARRELKYGQHQDTEEAALGLSDVRPCIVIWAVGIGLSLLAFAVGHVAAHFRPVRPSITRHTVRQAW